MGGTNCRGTSENYEVIAILSKLTVKGQLIYHMPKKL